MNLALCVVSGVGTIAYFVSLFSWVTSHLESAPSQRPFIGFQALRTLFSSYRARKYIEVVLREEEHRKLHPDRGSPRYRCNVLEDYMIT